MTYRNKKLLEICRRLPCQMCGNEDGTVCAAHSNQQRDGKGMGIKADDFRIAALCSRCHFDIDQGSQHNKVQRQKIWEEAHRKTVGQFFMRQLVGPL